MPFQPVIAKIQLNNFMCHDNFEIEFTEMITCITGVNGSGKSAVMVALGLLFGQRSKSMDRGNSYVELIKNGKENSTITITINNVANLDGYDNEITIQKRLYRKERKSETQIKKGGKYVTIPTSELNNIIKEMSISFNNPMNFLTQDNSKRILNVTTPSGLYNFYYEGTEFKNIAEEIREGEGRIEEMDEKMDQAFVKLKEYEEQIAEYKKDLNFVSRDFNGMLKELDNEEEWIGVAEHKRRMESEKAEIDQISKELNTLTAKMNEPVQHTETRTIDTRTLKETIAEVTATYTAVKADYEKSMKDFAQREQTYKAAKQRNNKEVLEAKVSTLSSKCEQLTGEKNQLESEQMAIFDKVQEEKERNNKLETRKRAIQNTLQEMQNKQVTPFSTTFKRKFEGVKRVIKSKIDAGHFKDTVIGPVCDYITLKERKWYKPASIIMKRTLDNFIVFNSEDKNKLLRIFQDQKIHCSILLMPSKQIITPKQLPGYTTLLDVVEVKFEIFKNVLITMHSAEETILIEDRNTVYDVAQRERGNISAVYLPTGDRIKNINGNMSDYRERETGKYFFEANDDRMKTLVEDLRKCVPTNKWIAKENEIVRKLGDVMIKLNRESNTLEDCRSELRTYETMKDDDLLQLERKLAVMTKQGESMKNKKEKLEREKRDLEMALRDAEAKNSETTRKQREVANEKMRMANKYHSDKSRLETQIKMKTDAIEKYADFVTRKTEELISNGAAIVDNPRSLGQINEHRAKTRGLIKRAQDIGSKEEITKSVNELSGEKNNLLSIIATFKESIELTNTAVENRKQKRDEIKNAKTRDTMAAFKEYTATSGYDGELIFDHDAQKLDLRMRVHNNTVKGSKNTLSGGERSFAGVCFLLSLWSSFNCPVKVLDEFDVFMDDENRRNAIKRIFQFITKHNSQVIMITPLDVKEIQKEGGDIKRIQKAG